MTQESEFFFGFGLCGEDGGDSMGGLTVLLGWYREEAALGW